MVQGPNQDKKEDNDVMNPGNFVGKGIYHYYNINHLILNQNVGAESVNGKDFLFIFMCKVNPEKIKQPASNPTMWLLNNKDEIIDINSSSFIAPKILLDKCKL